MSIVHPDWDAVRADAAEADRRGARRCTDALERSRGQESFRASPQARHRSSSRLIRTPIFAIWPPIRTNRRPDISRGFQATPFFLAGPAGYDAVFSVKPGAIEGLGGIGRSEPVLVEISASTLLYDLPPAKAAPDLPVRGLEKDLSEYPPFRSRKLSALRFEKYGMTYVVVDFLFRRPRPRALDFLQSGRSHRATFPEGAQSRGRQSRRADSVRVCSARRGRRMFRPISLIFPPDDCCPAPAFERNDGVADKTVYANIRFPFDKAPSFANSQSFMHWGDCDQTGRSPHPRGRKDAPYRCRVNLKPLVFNEAAPENYAYPWRDNFCEHRHFFVGQCPAGQGHQGQDFRPASCKLRKEGADRCEPYQDDVVAARDGMILRSAAAGGRLSHHQFGVRACALSLHAHASAPSRRGRRAERARGEGRRDHRQGGEFQSPRQSHDLSSAFRDSWCRRATAGRGSIPI